jgi:hypothetical protein
MSNEHKEPEKCIFCQAKHYGECQRLKSVHFYKDGTIKDFELYPYKEPWLGG